MITHQLIAVSTLLCAALWCSPSARGADNQTGAPQRPAASFTTNIEPSGGQALASACTVRFGPALPISALSFSRDGKQLAQGGYQEVLLWDLQAPGLAKRLGIGQLAGMVRAIVFVDGGNTLAVDDGLPYQPGAVKLFDVETGQLKAAFGEPKSPVGCLAVSADGKTLASKWLGVLAAGPEQLVRTIKEDLAKPIKEQLAELTNPAEKTAAPPSLEPSPPNGEKSPPGEEKSPYTLAAGDADGHVYVWNLNTGKLEKTLDAHQGPVLGLAFSPDGKRLATASADQTLAVWETGTWQRIIQYDLRAAVQGAAFSQDGKTVMAAVGGLDDEPGLRLGRIDAYLESLSKRAEIPAPKADVIATGGAAPQAIVWPAGKGNTLFIACDDRTVRGYQGNKLTNTYQGHTDWVYGVAAAADGSKLASAGADGTVKLWNLPSGKPAATFLQLVPGSDEWLMITPQGFFVGSSPAAIQAIQWKKTAASSSPEELIARYQNPELVRKALALSNQPPNASPQKPKPAPTPPPGPPKPKS